MRCPSCDHDNSAERRFCGECGAALAVLCASCGTPNGPREKFCGGCGAGLPPAPTRPPATSTPKHLAEKIRTSRAALEGERKQVTVLFADVKGDRKSTRLNSSHGYISYAVFCLKKKKHSTSTHCACT